MPVVKPIGEHELFLFFVQFALLLVAARGLGELAVRLRLPSVVGELLAGLLLGPSVFGSITPGLFRSVFPARAEQFHLLEVLSWLGVVMLLILTGLETDVQLIARKGRGALAISLGGIAVPFGTGVALGSVLPGDFVADPGKRLVFTLFIGTAMSISAIPVIAKVLMELKIIRRDIGQITLAAGMIDDTVGWILLSVVAGLATGGSVNLATVGQSIASVVAVVAVAFTVGRRFVTFVIRELDNRIGGDTVKITALMALALVFGSITHWLHLEAVLGAFIAGILVGQVKRFDERLRHIFEQAALGIFAPVFFAYSGLKVDLARLIHPSVLGVGLLILAVATVGKFIGAYGGARLSRLSHWEALSLGAGMNARGAMEIIVATIGYSRGILTAEMYSIILMVAVATSLMAPPLLRWTLAHVEIAGEEKERLETEERRKEGFVSNLKRVLLPVPPGVDVRPAAEIVALVVADEDVEVTELLLEDDGGEPAEEAEKEVTEALEEHGDRPRLLVRQTDGSAAERILGEAERGYDLLVMATTREAKGHRPFADVVDAVIQDSPCPLFVLNTPQGNGAHSPGPLRHIMVPVAGRPSDSAAAEVAFTIAAGTGIVVDLVHVVSGPQHTSRVGSDHALLDAVEIGEDLVEKIAEMGRAMGATVECHVLVADHPERAIVERAEQRGDLIVVASHRRLVSQRAFFGHRTDHILENATRPVLMVSGT
ncbi:MAG TPA: cation:proton antiporter [Acidimicrobiia bacterium]|nr:cation:proton antiporter [Acidimicrobiia bacterium]